VRFGYTILYVEDVAYVRDPDGNLIELASPVQ
jgi:catechol 2,3-dioxygenase-like lactoylglutathione lyase family enzyme